MKFPEGVGREKNPDSAKSKIFTFFSPVKRCMQTTVALNMAQVLAQKGKTLYISMEAFYGNYIPEKEIDGNIADLLYYYDCDASKIALYLQKVCVSVGAFDVIMYPQIKTESAESSYYIHKIGIVMLLMIAGSLIAGVLYLSALTQNAVIRNSKVERNDYGQDSSSITLDAKNEEGDEIGEFELNIAARQYSKKEADKLFKKASEQLVKQILQDNLSQDEVRTDLYLPDKMDNFPFQISCFPYWRKWIWKEQLFGYSKSSCKSEGEYLCSGYKRRTFL